MGQRLCLLDGREILFLSLLFMNQRFVPCGMIFVEGKDGVLPGEGSDFHEFFYWDINS